MHPRRKSCLVWYSGNGSSLHSPKDLFVENRWWRGGRRGPLWALCRGFEEISRAIRLTALKLWNTDEYLLSLRLHLLISIFRETQWRQMSSPLTRLCAM
jgi:hypothetical protein